jgi:tetratricopeptide (TPR) repeat protein
VPVPRNERTVEVGEPEGPRVEPVGLKHLLRGLLYLASGQAGAAVPHLRLALIYAPDSAFLYERLSRAWAASGELERARLTLEEGLERAPGDPWLNWLAGDLAGREQRFRDAAVHLERAVVEEEVIRHAGPLLVDALLWIGDTAAADRAADRLLGRRPGDAELAIRIAGAFEDHGELSLSLRDYRRARVRRPPADKAALGEARILTLLGRHGEAAEALVPLLALYPDRLDLYVTQTRLLVRAGREDAEAYRREALRQAHGDAYATMVVVTGDLVEGRLELGLRLLRGLVARQPQLVELRAYLADVLIRLGDGAGCVRVLADHASPRLHRPRARCWALHGRLDLALEQLTRAALEGERPREALLDAAQLLSQFAGEKDARRTFSDLLIRVRGRITPEDVTVVRAQLADHLGHGAEALEFLAQLPPERLRPPDMALRRADLESRHGKLGRALGTLRSLLREDPTDPQRLNALGFILADADVRLDEAEVLLRRAHRLSPDDGYIIDSLGWLFYRRGAVDTAIATLARANRAAPGDPEILRHLGDAYRAAGNNEAARATYRAALDAHPVPPLRELIRRRLEVLTS